MIRRAFYGVAVAALVGCGGSGASRDGGAGQAGASGGGNAGRGGGGATGGGGGLTGGSNLYCPGATEWPAGETVCRDGSECSPDELCYPNGPPDFSGVCGGCIPPASPCTSDRDCATGICGPFPDPCNCGFNANECAPACTDASCADGERCATDGRCEPIPCDDGFSCPDQKRCGPTSPDADANGCEWTPCTDGWTCIDGYVCEPTVGNIHDPHGCRQLSCSEPGGADCGPNTVCNPSGIGSGCEVKDCQRDSDCDCGVCMNDKCARRPGVCASPASGPS